MALALLRECFFFAMDRIGYDRRIRWDRTRIERTRQNRYIGQIKIDQIGKIDRKGKIVG